MYSLASLPGESFVLLLCWCRHSEEAKESTTQVDDQDEFQRDGAIVQELLKRMEVVSGGIAQVLFRTLNALARSCSAAVDCQLLRARHLDLAVQERGALGM